MRGKCASTDQREAAVTHDPQAAPSLTLWWAALFAIIAACVVWISGTKMQLPEMMVTSWSNGLPTRRMPRADWINFAMMMTAGPPLVIAIGGWLATKFLLSKRLSNLAGMLKYDSQGDMVRGMREAVQFALIIACGSALWLALFHAIMMSANAATPPRFDMLLLWVWVAAWAVFVLVVVLVKLWVKARATLRA